MTERELLLGNGTAGQKPQLTDAEKLARDRANGMLGAPYGKLGGPAPGTMHARGRWTKALEKALQLRGMQIEDVSRFIVLDRIENGKRAIDLEADPDSPEFRADCALVEIAEKFLDVCKSGDISAVRELTDRLQGKAMQPVDATVRGGVLIYKPDADDAALA